MIHGWAEQMKPCPSLPWEILESQYKVYAFNYLRDGNSPHVRITVWSTCATRLRRDRPS